MALRCTNDIRINYKRNKIGITPNVVGGVVDQARGGSATESQFRICLLIMNSGQRHCHDGRLEMLGSNVTKIYNEVR